MFLGIINVPNIITSLAIAAAMAACGLTAAGHVAAAMLCLLGATICDALDGMIARRQQRDERTRAFGAQLDSLADMASYGVAPCFIAFLWGLNAAGDFVLFACYVTAAAFRLAWFDCHGPDEHAGRRYYTGMPSTYAALVLPIALAAQQHWSALTSPWYLRGVLAGIALLFVLRIPVPDLRQLPGGFMALLLPLGYWLWHLLS